MSGNDVEDDLSMSFRGNGGNYCPFARRDDVRQSESIENERLLRLLPIIRDVTVSSRKIGVTSFKGSSTLSSFRQVHAPSSPFFSLARVADRLI